MNKYIQLVKLTKQKYFIFMNEYRFEVILTFVLYYQFILHYLALSFSKTFHIIYNNFKI